MPEIFIMNGPEKGRSLSFEKGMVVLGRDPENALQIRDKSVSRKHLRIEKKSEKYFIEDMGSRNGTFVDGVKLEPGEKYEVKEGALVGVGKIFIAIGKVSHDETLAALNSIDLFKEEKLREEAVMDRPLTAKKNMELIHRVSEVLMQPLNISDLLEKALICIMDLLRRVDRGVVILLDRESGDLGEIISVPKSEKEGQPIPYSRSIVDRVLRGGEPISMVDTQTEEENNLSESIQRMEIRSVMCVPLKSKSVILGVIYVDSLRRPNGFRKEDLDLLVSVSNPVVLAIENSLINRTQKVALSSARV